ncbi:dynein regulatory complex subunit 2-like isoform X2 [Nerophis lumbriciformis]|uniref:dynein regulatory complex subunit 2-like isoform X2 n=1 Tax=Nerophis lumbriciformis TaxID=546530 RepID=UPI002AE0A96D|nr:dynein regulatory complex subunit 2-like isoform X2 [Nerophis lumbriciformis]
MAEVLGSRLRGNAAQTVGSLAKKRVYVASDAVRMPRKVKRGGGASEEEEDLQQQRGRVKDPQETGRKREELLTLFLKDKVEREERNSAVNLAELERAWGVVLRRTKSAELRRDIIILRRTFERQLDGLDDVIKDTTAEAGIEPGTLKLLARPLYQPTYTGVTPLPSLLLTGCRFLFVRQSLTCDLQQAEQQSAQVRRRHLQHVERMRDLQDERRAFVRRRWEGSLRRISAGFMAERSDTAEEAQRRQVRLEDTAFSLDSQHQDVMRAVRQVYGESMAAWRSAQQDRVIPSCIPGLRPCRQLTCCGFYPQVAALRGADAEKLAEKRRQMQEEVEACGSALGLMSRNQRLVHMTDVDVKRVRRLQSAVISLRTKLGSFETSTAWEAGGMAAAKAELNEKSGKLRDHLARARQAARKQLADLALQSDTAANKLQMVIGKGEKVLHAAMVCHKLEDTLSPSPRGADSQWPAQPTATVTSHILSQRGEGVINPSSSPQTFPEVRQLTRRLNSALLLRDALANHQEALRRDNQQLRLLLRRRLDNMRVGDNSGGALHGSHAPLSVKAALTTASPPFGAGRPTVIEAALAAKHLL